MNFEQAFSIFIEASLLVKIVMIFLLTLSIVSWTIIINRWYVLRRVNKGDKVFSKLFYSGDKFTELTMKVKQTQNPIGLSRIFLHALGIYQKTRDNHHQTPEAILKGLSRQVSANIAEEIEEQDFGLTMLSTITGIAPYIGLFGTVWGIIEVFSALGSVQQVNIQQIAPSIAEALIATALGLFVAIPSLVAYNIFHRMINANETNYYNFQDHFESIIQNDIYHRHNNPTK